MYLCHQLRLLKRRITYGEVLNMHVCVLMGPPCAHTSLSFSPEWYESTTSIEEAEPITTDCILVFN